MLQSIEIKNFRSCQDVRLRLGDPVIALLGKNGAGKTNVLHAIQTAADLCVGNLETSLNLYPRDPQKPTGFVLEFVLGTSLIVYRIDRSGISSSQDIFRETLEKNNSILYLRIGESATALDSDLPDNIRIGSQSSTLPLLLQILPLDHKLVVELYPIASYLRAIRYYPLLQGFQEHFTGPQSRNNLGEAEGSMSPYIEAGYYKTWKSKLAEGTARRSVQMRLLHLSLTDKDKFDELKDLLGSNGLGLIDDIRVDEVRSVTRIHATKPDEISDTVYSIKFMPGKGLAGAGNLYRFNGLSAGTWRILQLLTYLIFDTNSCMLLEQPEDSIHPGLLAKVIDILRTYSGRTQLICTTHSPRVMNLVGPAGIRLVTAEEGLTKVSELSSQDQQAAKGYLEDHGTLAEFLETL